MFQKEGLYNICEAVREDTTAMMDLIKELAAYEKKPDAVTVSLEAFQEAGFGANSVWKAFLAKESATGNIVGMALYYIRYSTWKGKMFYLEDIIVGQDYRNRGIGKRLMNAILDKAKEAGMSGVTWQVLDWNKPAIGFYGKFGDVVFEDNWLNVKILL